MPTEVRSVLFVITRGDQIGGAQIHVRDLAAGARAAGWRVAVALGTSGPFETLLQEAGVPVLRIAGLERNISPLNDLRAIGSVRRLFGAWKPGFVSCHTAKAGLVGRIAAWSLGIPSQYTVHGWQFAEGISRTQRWTVWLAEWVLARLSKRIITVSEYDRRLAVRWKIANARRLVTVHNGMPRVETPSFPENAVPALVMVARFMPQKDHGTLFAALALLESRPWVLHLVGDGPGQAAWEAWAGNRGWGGRVVFHGLSHEVPLLLARSDIFVLSSNWEGFPNSILEAMRAGLPVVASDVGGVAEAVNGRTGIVVAPRNPAALASAIETLLADRGRRRELGSAGRERFLAEFTFEAMLAKTFRVWDQVLG